MVTKQYDIQLDLKQKIAPPVINLVQGDNKTNVFNILLTEDGIPLQLDGSNITITMKKADENVVVGVCSIVDATAGKVRYVCGTEELSFAGTVNFTVEIYSNDMRISTTQSKFKVVGELGNETAVPSVTEYTVLTTLFNDFRGLAYDEVQAQYYEEKRQADETTRTSSENSRVIAENNRSSAETSRVNAEASRESKEAARVTAETARASAETTRGTNESNRINAESTRVSDENTRKTNETTRNNSENSRITAESARVTAENTRVSQENTRKTNETTRGTNESTRVTKENERISNENTRKSQETSRVSAESARATNETNRTNAETARVNAETSRVNAENSRVNFTNAVGIAENARVEAENTRVSNENTRKTSENTRISAENARQVAETTRQTTFNNNEAARQSSFDTNETARQTNEVTRQNQETTRQNQETARQGNEGYRVQKLQMITEANILNNSYPEPISLSTTVDEVGRVTKRTYKNLAGLKTEEVERGNFDLANNPQSLIRKLYDSSQKGISKMVHSLTYSIINEVTGDTVTESPYDLIEMATVRNGLAINPLYVYNPTSIVAVALNTLVTDGSSSTRKINNNTSALEIHGSKILTTFSTSTSQTITT